MIPLWEKEMAAHSSVLAWEIPWTEEPSGLQSMGSLRVGHNWATSLSLFTFMHWRRKWQLTPVFLPGASQGRRSLVGCRLWGRTESDTPEATYQQQQQQQQGFRIPGALNTECKNWINLWFNGVESDRSAFEKVRWKSLLVFILSREI